MHTYFSELLRVIDSLQLTDKMKVIATPANWTVRVNELYSLNTVIIHSKTISARGKGDDTS